MYEVREHEVELDDGRVVNTKEGVVAAFREKWGDEEIDMLSFLMGASFDEDPLAFLVACHIVYERDCSTLCGRPYYDPAPDYLKLYPNATRKALTFRRRTGDEFYAKYGADKVWELWNVVWERTGLTLGDIFSFERDSSVEIIVRAGNMLRSKIAWSIAGDWLGDMTGEAAPIELDGVYAVCGDSEPLEGTGFEHQLAIDKIDALG